MKNSLTRRTFINDALIVAAGLGIHLVVQARDKGSLSTNTASVLEAVDFSKVTLSDAFWAPKQIKVATVTIGACIYQTEEKTGRIRNFEKAAKREGKHEGIYYDDSDVYKALEAIAYSLKNRPDAALEKKADEWIDKIAAAQLQDGYINTYYTLTNLRDRWTDMEKHEDYCGGHLIEAAIAYYRATGKRKLLDVAIRFADHLDATFRIPNRHWVTGHEEIELALVKLYHLTREEKYLKLAEWYLDQRGHGYGKGVIWERDKNPEYCQDNVPVKDQREIVGHAVRAMYLYTGAADVAAASGDSGYVQAMERVWEDVVYRNMYITGAIGSSGSNEGFSNDYDLPNTQAYCETCASVGMVFWNQRMHLMTGESRYIDVLERSLYNGALDGLSLSGDHFFYANPLASDATSDSGEHGRKEWFGTACCPSNIARLVASLGGYVYSTGDRDICVNLFVASSAELKVGRTDVALRLATDYPWSGRVKLEVDPARSARFAVRIRIPGWASGVATPGNLYAFTDTTASTIKFSVNDAPVKFQHDKGYAVIEREWRKGDVVEFDLPMRVQTVTARAEVKTNHNRIALQRGPLVYCAEGTDNQGVFNIITARDNAFTEHAYRILDEPIVAIQSEASLFVATADGLGVVSQSTVITAIPYYTWANRNNYDMQVWLPTKIEGLKIGA